MMSENLLQPSQNVWDSVCNTGKTPRRQKVRFLPSLKSVIITFIALIFWVKKFNANSYPVSTRKKCTSIYKAIWEINLANNQNKTTFSDLINVSRNTPTLWREHHFSEPESILAITKVCVSANAMASPLICTQSSPGIILLCGVTHQKQLNKKMRRLLQ